MGQENGSITIWQHKDSKVWTQIQKLTSFMTHGLTVRRMKFGKPTVRQNGVDYTLATCGNDHTVRIFSVFAEGFTPIDKIELYGQQQVFGEDSLGNEFMSLADFWK